MPNDHGVPDPKALRALAHPLRWKLLDLLGSESAATATRCAEVLGESVASCSYHLGILAKYGYVEEVPASGREKPWRVSNPRQDLGSQPGMDAEGELASEAAMEVFLDHELERTKLRLRRASLEPPGWRPELRGVSRWMTADEFAAIKTQLIALLEQFAPRLTDAARRPEGCREVRLCCAATAAPPLPGKTPSGTTPAPPGKGR